MQLKKFMGSLEAGGACSGLKGPNRGMPGRRPVLAEEQVSSWKLFCQGEAGDAGQTAFLKLAEPSANT